MSHLVTIWSNKAPMDRSALMDLMSELADLLSDVAAGVNCKHRARMMSKRFADIAWQWKLEDEQEVLRMLGKLR